MQMIEIRALDNGAHNNQTLHGDHTPAGWAVIPEGMALGNFPFGEVTAEEIDGVMTVTGWVPNELPEPVEPEPEPEPGVSIDERVTALEESLAETDEAAIELYEATLAQEAVNAEQDEAIIEIYEMLGGE